MSIRKIFVMLMFGSLLIVVAAAAFSQQTPSDKLFAEMYRVLSHPRCMNCHPKGDSPKQGIDAHVHMPPVARGPKDKGVAGLECAACHQATNFRASGVPGAPNWHLAPLSMAWENLSKDELCRAMLDKSKNGNRDLTATVEHLTRDELVGWGWAPGIDANGKARDPVPIPKSEFSRIVREWAKLGAQCPE